MKFDVIQGKSVRISDPNGKMLISHITDNKKASADSGTIEGTSRFMNQVLSKGNSTLNMQDAAGSSADAKNKTQEDTGRGRRANSSNVEGLPRDLMQYYNRIQILANRRLLNQQVSNFRSEVQMRSSK